ncbi:substrate-binding periplasmic protein [Desulforhopalus singaporensis]|uniref:Polar amino acid transport system substrate-binding protein n=1 Tax=Desulforhopalus singaporensis TaxID=91360 RepID=A0A1H0W670_9BACT|nr:transporter substrate-binding domain-containing protein [Desulforhopalus singaporensis]SDP86234.1 polar amino acid transport system substrate-binding protein [Desulforhopalus singaporensis]
MSKRISIITLILLSFLFNIASAQEIVRLTNGEWQPLMSKNLKHFGVFSHIVSEAFLLEGIEVQYAFYSWQEAYDLAEKGDKYDGSVGWVATPDRETTFYFTDPVTVNKKVFFHLKSFPFQWNTIDDLVDLNIGAVNKYTYGEAFDTAAKTGKLKVEFVNQDKELIKRLMTGGIQVFPMAIEVGYSILHHELSLEQASLVTNHHRPVSVAPLSVMISKNIDPARAQRLVTAFNRGLARLKKSGAYEEMIWASRQGEYKIYVQPVIKQRVR